MTNRCWLSSGANYRQIWGVLRRGRGLSVLCVVLGAFVCLTVGGRGRFRILLRDRFAAFFEYLLGIGACFVFVLFSAASFSSFSSPPPRECALSVGVSFSAACSSALLGISAVALGGRWGGGDARALGCGRGLRSLSSASWPCSRTEAAAEEVCAPGQG